MNGCGDLSESCGARVAEYTVVILALNTPVTNI